MKDKAEAQTSGLAGAVAAARAPLPTNNARLHLLGVDYFHVRLDNGDDLYLTQFGAPFWEHLMPVSWYERAWFEQSREKLLGTGTVYRVRTKAVRGVSKDLVVKWCRVGETVPFDTFTLSKFAEAEFNSPYEEFALVMEMRENRFPVPVYTHKPLAIYVPAQRLQLWQTGRSESAIAQKKARYRDVELDICRQYILIYEWIKGESAKDVLMRAEADPDTRRQTLNRFVERATGELRQKGYRVLDMKPEHIIVRTRPDGSFGRRRRGSVPYALVDFELLTRTPEHEEAVRAARRAEYLQRQRDRFARARPAHFPPGLYFTTVHGVDYVYGHTESTHGTLWVVGRDPSLFDYFQPERWRRTPRTNLSRTGQVYHTLTKDKINLVWKISHVGEIPSVPFGGEHERRFVPGGFNSPFEEFALALELSRRGIPTVYPRAIYMTGQESSTAMDMSRYESHRNILTPDGLRVLRPDHNYITVWGFWNGLDELLARQDAEYCRGIDCQRAVEQELVRPERAAQLLAVTRSRIHAVGMDSPSLRLSHILLTINSGGTLLLDEDGLPLIRLCNFETLRVL